MRLRELDFLRGIAVLLVFLRHQPLFQWSTNMGWIGVDLFFVLSGFLVSSLLFKEYQVFGNIQPLRFLARRGFKIYPLFYLSYPVHLFFIDPISYRGILSDLTFTQNYFYKWGYANQVSWTLAIEEHFYIGLAAILYFGLKNNVIKLKSISSNSTLPALVMVFFSFSLAYRCIRYYFYGVSSTQIFTMTHFRMDSLLAGVLISYLYCFRFSDLESTFNSAKRPLLIVCFLGLAWTPFISNPLHPFIITIGFTLLYISFAIMLMYFALTKNINNTLNGLFSRFIVDTISKTGYCSYAIYLIHWPVILGFNQFLKEYGLNTYMVFTITITISLALGFLMTYKIESYFLSLRSQWFPSRVNQIGLSKNIR